MSEFYHSISESYDQLFPYNPVQEEFITRNLISLSGKKILDAGCGTGSLAISMGRKGARVDGFDLDDSMIAAAKAKKPQAIDVNFAVGDLKNVNQNYKAGMYDFAYCFGNTLVHLDNATEVEQFISSISEVLKPEDSMLAIQIVNYDKIMAKRVKKLPAIENDKVFFKRFYKHLDNGKIDFLTTLSDKKTGEELKNSQILTPILVEDLMDIAAKYFPFVEAFGSFKEEMWTDGSFHTILLASR